MRFKVQGVPKIGGTLGTFRAGRMWPTDGVMVEIVDQDEDPKTPALDGTLRIGKVTWEALKADKELIRWMPEGDIEDFARVQADNVALRARVAELEAKLAPPPKAKTKDDK